MCIALPTKKQVYLSIISFQYCQLSTGQKEIISYSVWQIGISFAESYFLRIYTYAVDKSTEQSFYTVMHCRIFTANTCIKRIRARLFIVSQFLAYDLGNYNVIYLYSYFHLVIDHDVYGNSP